MIISFVFNDYTLCYIGSFQHLFSLVAADLRKLVDELQSLKANLEETLKEFQRQFFGVRSEKTKAPDKKQEQQNATAEPAKTVEVKSHTRQSL